MVVCLYSTISLKSVTKRFQFLTALCESVIQIIVGKEENADIRHFPRFPQSVMI